MAKPGVTQFASLALLAALLCAPAACGPKSEVPASSCGTIPWGGWDGTPQCAGVAAVIIGGADRACNQHSDCVLVGVSRCAAHSVNRAALARFQQFPPPCDHPLAGLCAPSPQYAACNQGCCMPSATPPPAPAPPM